MTPVGNLKKNRPGWLVAASNLFLFLLLPCLALWILGSALIRHNDDLVKAHSMSLLEAHAERICSFIDPMNFLEEHFRKFAAAVDWQNIDSNIIKDLYAQYHGEKLKFIPYVFKNGELITPPDLLEKTGERIKNIWFFKHGHSTKSKLQPRIETKAWFGIGLEQFCRRLDLGRPFEFMGRKGRGLLLYARPENSEPLDGLFLISWAIPEAEIFTQFIPASLSGTLQIRVEPRGLQTEIGLSKPEKQQHQEYLNLRKSLGNRYVSFRQRFPELNHDLYRTVLHALIMLLLMILATILRDSALRESIGNLSVRLKLVALIIYAVLLPLSGLGYFGWKFVTERRELLNQEAFIACQSSISDLENDFDQEKINVLRMFRSLQNLPEMATSTNLLLPKFAAMVRNRMINWLEIRDINSNVVISTEDQETSDKISVVAKVFSRHGIHNFLNQRLPPKQTIVPSAGEIMLQEFLESPFGGWARIFESPDELHIVSFGGYDLLWYWNVFPQPEFRPAFLVCDQNVVWSVKSYLRERLNRRLTHEHGSLRRLAWSVEDLALLGADEEKPQGELKDFIGRIRRNNSPQIGMIDWQSEKWLVAGAPGKRLLGNVILSLYPMAVIDDQIDLISSDLSWGVIFALMLALLVGRLFSSTLISPLAQIMNGVQALRRRDTSHRIEILQNDELGQLSANFNRTIETLEDVLFAKELQAQMIPDRAPEIAGFHADIFNLPAADLGGDYCDIQPLNSKQWLLVIGDVTGHGVSSSLVTSMAKSIVAQSITQPVFSLQDLLACLNELLFSQFKRRKCMTFFAAILDIETGSISCANAGHPLPLHFSGGELRKFPELFHAPLGFSVRDQSFPTADLLLADDDCLILYTDVFVELHDKTGKPLGTDGFARLCREFLHLPPEDMRKAILARVQSIAATELDDDLTLIILKKTACICLS